MVLYKNKQVKFITVDRIIIIHRESHPRQIQCRGKTQANIILRIRRKYINLKKEKKKEIE
jgi:hypothetical protein